MLQQFGRVVGVAVIFHLFISFVFAIIKSAYGKSKSHRI